VGVEAILEIEVEVIIALLGAEDGEALPVRALLLANIEAVGILRLIEAP
jgi:hypothetical protein